MKIQIYKLNIKFHSPILTPLHADTIFGHLCWALYYKEGESALLEMLTQFQNFPPFLISDGFPTMNKNSTKIYLFPKPFLADIIADSEKEIKKLSFLTYENFNLVRKGIKPNIEVEKEISYHVKSQMSVHNIINRNTSATFQEGGIFGWKEIFIPEISIFIKIFSEEWIEKLSNLFKFLTFTGFGSKKSIGKGTFKMEQFESFNLEEISNPNGFVTLSNFCPSENDPTEGIYKTFVKYGKLGEEFTFSGNPFKKPLLMIKTGSVFKTDGKPKDFYGRMVENVSDVKPQVIQYAYAFPVPIIYPESKNEY